MVWDSQKSETYSRLLPLLRLVIASSTLIETHIVTAVELLPTINNSSVGVLHFEVIMLSPITHTSSTTGVRAQASYETSSLLLLWSQAIHINTTGARQRYTLHTQQGYSWRCNANRNEHACKNKKKCKPASTRDSLRKKGQK